MIPVWCGLSLELSVRPLGVREGWLMVIDSEMNGSVPKTAWTDFKESSTARHWEWGASLAKVPSFYSGLELKPLRRSARTVWGLNKAVKWDCGGFPTCCCACIDLFYTPSNLCAVSGRCTRHLLNALTRRPLVMFHAWSNFWLKTE